MDNPKISVIIPNYNKSMYLEQCIDSIFAQTYQPFEVIVVDDCSTDNSRDVLNQLHSKYGDKLINIFLDKNAGVSHARNTGIETSKGDFLIWVDSDDFFCNRFYFESLSKYCNEKELVYGKWVFAEEDGQFSCSDKLKFYSKKFSKRFTKINLLYFLKNNYIPRNFIIGKKILKITGTFDETKSLYEDTDLLCRLADKVKFRYINVIGPAYRQTSNGLSKASNELHKQALEGLRNKYETKSLTTYRKLFNFKSNFKNRCVKLILICIEAFLRFFIRLFVHPKSNYISFESNEFIFDNAYALYLFLKKYKKLNLFYVVYSDKEKQLALKMGFDKKHLIYLYRLSGSINNLKNKLRTYYICRKCSLFFISYVNFLIQVKIKLTAKQNVVNLKHGQFPLKSMNNYYDLLLSGFKSKNKIYFRIGTEEAFNKLPSSIKNLPVNHFYAGMPRIDRMSEDVLPTFNKIIGNKIGDGAKIILSMTTFRNFGKGSFFMNNFPIPLNQSDFDDLENFLQKNNCFYIIKLHHMNSLQDNDKFIEKYKHIIVLTTDDFVNNNISVEQIFKYTDALITDYSSTLFDYLYVDKPIGFVITDEENYKKEEGFTLPLEEVIVGETIKNKNDLFNFINHVNDKCDDYSDKREQLSLTFNGKKQKSYCEQISKMFIDKKLKLF